MTDNIPEQIPENNIPPENATNNPSPQPEGKKNSAMPVIIILLLIVAGIAGYMYINGDNNSGSGNGNSAPVGSVAGSTENNTEGSTEVTSEVSTETVPSATAPAETEAPTDATVNYNLYKKTLREYSNEYYEGTYFLADLDKDGVKEILITPEASEAGTYTYIHTIENNQSVFVDMISTGHASFEVDADGKVYLVQGHMGYGTLSEVTKDKYAIETTIIIEDNSGDYSKMDKYLEKLNLITIKNCYLYNFGAIDSAVGVDFEPYLVDVMVDELEIYDKPWGNVVQTITDYGVYTIVDDTVDGYTWGKLKSGAGWIQVDGESVQRRY